MPRKDRTHTQNMVEGAIHSTGLQFLSCTVTLVNPPYTNYVAGFQCEDDPNSIIFVNEENHEDVLTVPQFNQRHPNKPRVLIMEAYP